MSPATFLRTVTLLTLCLIAPLAQSAAFVRGAHYRLGDDDPGAAANAIGNDPTRDSFADALHLSRLESPRYSGDVPPFGPSPNKLSMAFANVSLGGPAVPGYYGRNSSIEMVSGGFALEAWVKHGGLNVGPTPPPALQLIAYNGIPVNDGLRTANGFGLFYKDGDYVARIGGLADITLGAAQPDIWHHLAYVHSLGTSSYYYDGKLVRESASDPVPLAASGGFWIGGNAHPLIDPGANLFNGWIDEVRFQSFNPLAAGAFDPTNFLITPEPSAAAVLLLLAFAARRRP